MVPARRFLAALAILVAAPWLATAQDASRSNTKENDKAPAAANKDKLKVSGVIVKVEGDDSKPRKLTINTAVVWRDWVRDQAPTPSGEKTKGTRPADSVATRGQPASPDSLVIVELASDVPVECLFRASDDEASDSKTREKALAKEHGNAKDQPAKGTKAKASDLKKGLFVAVDFRADGDHKQARRVVIVKPAGGPNTPDSAGGTEVEAKKVK
ncbi:MAG TPA: hypothetical protein VG406_11235 [Isosphaeraceae bacterium]|jgi:hypothetical protein|nr:hypothetical protein [Isosphaeraceae bacterium]